MALTAFTYAGGTANYSYDNDGLVTGIGSYTITRNAGNGLPEAVSGNGLSIGRAFNGYGEISGQTVSVNSQGINSWNLIRDDNGRITQKTESIDGTTSNYTYTYDPMGRLLTVTKDSVLIEEYEYDDNGTRSSEINTLRGITGRTFSYSDEDHLLTAGSVSYQYDVDGFLTSRTNGTEISQYNYSTRGELLMVDLPDGRTIEYEHDPLGRRIAKKINGVIVEKYLWQGLTRLLAVYDGNDARITRFEYADGRMPVAMTTGGSTYFLSYDQVGSLKAVADSSGNMVKKIEYDSFGNIINDSNPSFAVPLGFAGGLHDRDTGLVRFGYRDYDPDIGRWTAKDPICFAGGDTDLYGYVLNDPVNLVDPYGLEKSPVGHLGWFSRSLSSTGGPPPGIEPVPIPWGEYKEIAKIAGKHVANALINAATTVELMIINPELLFDEFNPFSPYSAEAADNKMPYAPFDSSFTKTEEKNDTPCTIK